ncbi:MAG: ClbS/DfsB family four-helix bundle protein [Chloroflexi bacterium]|nr:ClbS/DfsB family four-helix bundle protein [Chloroflexota bacterium]
MKNHILAALGEILDRWEELLASMDEAHITAPLAPSDLSIKDTIAHLMAWQQRSIARVEAALHDREPDMPRWIPGVEPDSEENTDRINTWIYDTYRDHPWSRVHQEWQTGFRRFLEVSAGIAERDLLDSTRYPWLHRYPLALVLIASYDHHQEHRFSRTSRSNPYI